MKTWNHDCQHRKGTEEFHTHAVVSSNYNTRLRHVLAELDYSN